MPSPERKISAVPRCEEPPSVEARLAGLEAETARLRAEVVALHEEIRWLTDEDAHDGDPAHPTSGWLARGWVRASMLMTVVALVAFVSVPYLTHQLGPSAHQGDQAPPAASPVATPAEAAAPPALRAPAPTPKATARAYIPPPARARAAEVPEPAYVRPKTRPDAPPVDAATGPAPVRGESP